MSIDYDEYLLNLLGKVGKKNLTEAIKQGKTIAISGQDGTGKTTLVSVLQSLGANAVEDIDVHSVYLFKPIRFKIPNMKEEINYDKNGDDTFPLTNGRS